MISDNIRSVRAEIIAACERSGRNPADVTLIAVSKTKPVEMIEEAMAAGQTIFGENKVQELCEKEAYFRETDAEWHLIGHLQKNKVRKAVAAAKMIHSVDSIALAEEIQKESARINVVTDILLEVNVAAEESKFGLTPDAVEETVRAISAFPNVRIKGLMTVAPYTPNPEENRVYFAALRKLAVDIDRKNIDNVSMCCLSMGMSNDFPIAVEEGATFVRVGSLIFGERVYNV